MRLATLKKSGQAALTKRRTTGAPPVGESFPVPAPSMGMNTRDGISALNSLEARVIENMICESGRLVIRPGKDPHQAITGATSIGSSFNHERVDGSQVLLVAADGEIYDATGAPDQLSAGNYAVDRWSMLQLNDTTMGVNGTDTPWAYDGTTLGATGWSGAGLTIANLRSLHKVGVRVWATEEGSADVWYLPPEAITGTWTKFNLSLITKGGYCVGVYPFRTSTVFVMSTGDILAYQGDPATTFAIAGEYTAPKPVGHDPGVVVGSDCIIMTEGGPLPFEAIASGMAFDTAALQFWGKIAPSWVADFTDFGSNLGWNATYFKGLILFNIPTDETTSKQWVFNQRTKAWSYFTNLNGRQFTEHNGVLHFGDMGSNEIFVNRTGADDGSAIVATVRQAFFLPWGGKKNGEFTLARLNLRATGLVTARSQIDVDYDAAGISAPEVPISSSGSGPWDGPWDGPWGTDGAAQKRWSGIRGFGRAVAPVVEFHSSADVLEWSTTDIIGAVAAAGLI